MSAHLSSLDRIDDRATDAASPTIDRLIASFARTSPDAVAVRTQHEDATYAAVLQRAAAFASALRARGIERGTRVGMCADVSADFVAALLAVWSIGASYVPLDPHLPRLRLTHIIDDAGVALVLADDRRCAAAGIVPLLAFGEVASDTAPLVFDARPDDEAYVVYTSGSTGVPKGVTLHHAGLRNAILAANAIDGLRSSDRAICRVAIAFDLSVYELCRALAAGAMLLVAPAAVRNDTPALIRFIVANDATVLLTTPAFLAALLDEGAFAQTTSLRIVTSGGDTLSTGLCARFFATSPAALYNLYGPSEATILVTLHRCVPADLTTGEESVQLGPALPNTEVSVRDADLQPVAPGATGEIVIGGIQLAHGYIGRPEETAARFVADPARGGTMYRTGDLARVRDDGAIVFVGRNDKQLKIRGFRVEPAEVAAAIERVAGIRSAAVVGRRRGASGSGPLILVAYVVPRAGSTLDPDALREALRAQLPAPMVPAEIVALAAFPLTVNGKIDEAALAALHTAPPNHAPVETAPPVDDAAAVRGMVNDLVRAIWEELLERSGIGDDEDFVDAGGDSLLALRLMQRIEETFGRRVALADFFDRMTIAGLGALLGEAATADERDVTFNRDGTAMPLVYLHGDFAGGMYAWSLAKLLGPDQPMLVIPPHGMHGSGGMDEVPAMGRDVAARVARAYPAGPLRIGGFSAAGFVALEAARELRRAGRDVVDLIVIGMGAENLAFAPAAAIVRRLPLPVEARRELMSAIVRQGRRVARFARRIARGEPRAARPAPPARAPLDLQRRYRRYDRAAEIYVPQPYAGGLTVVWPRKQAPEFGDVRAWWSRVAPDVRVVTVGGSHLGSVLRHLPEIAAVLRAIAGA